jgi:eukaryotic-like serine/threonine-protein kinase
LTVIERMGRGGVFEVARVVDVHGLELVLKRPAPGLAQVGRRALEREREVLAAARGRRLPVLIGTGSDSHGPFLLEALADGEPIRVRRGQTLLESEKWLATASALAAALRELHALEDGHGPLELVHGDLSPDNIFISKESAVAFIDLSAATWRGGLEPVFPHARGTLPYTPPEIVRGERLPDRSGDVYALAAVLLWLAVDGFTDATTEPSLTLEIGTRGLRSDRIEHRSDLPASARQAIRSALEADPSRRGVRTARELFSEIGW